MRLVRTHAFATPDDAFILISRDERDRLRGLGCLALGLFVALLERSNYRSGRGVTGWGELVNALTPDQPERGARLPAPTRHQLEHMLRKLEALGLVARDKGANEQRGKLFFQLAPRTGLSAPAEQSQRVRQRVQQAAKPLKTGLPAHRHPRSSEGPSEVLQENSLPPTPVGSKLSTGRPITVPSRWVREAREKLKARGGREVAPPGGPNDAPAAHAPTVGEHSTAGGGSSLALGDAAAGAVAGPTAAGDLLSGLIARSRGPNTAI